MKNLPTTFSFVLLATLALSCNNQSTEQKVAESDTAKKETTDVTTTQQTNAGQFDINTIPVSDKELGAFPFFSTPAGLKIQNKVIQRNYDRLFFPIAGIMQPIEGKMWKTWMMGESGSGSWSLPFFEKSYDEAIKAVGGVKIFDGKVTKAELDRIKDQATYFGEDGSIDYWNDNVKVYAIRRANGEDVYIQLSGNSASGNIQILQKEAFKQTITMLKADQIQADLTNKGNAVLHINFDTDKATLKADGKEAVAEIAKALTADKSLKIAINGYTDNVGNEKRNLDLSKQRAETVKAALLNAGIDAARLSAGGFGQNSPIADNSSEEGKAQNRRVELIKQ